MEQNIAQLIYGGITDVLALVNWMFFAIFLFITWLVNTGTDHPTKVNWLNWLQLVPKALRALLLGILLAVPYFYLFDNPAGKEGIRGLLLAILAGMGLWKLGIEWVFGLIKKHILKITE